MKIYSKNDIHFKVDFTTYSVIIQLQNMMYRSRGKKSSIKSIMLFYFMKGLKVNQKYKPEILKKVINNSIELINVVTDLEKADQDLETIPSEEEEHLKGVAEKEKLLQRDLIDQFNLLRSKEFRLLKREEELLNRENSHITEIKNIHKLELDNYTLTYKVESLQQQLKFNDIEINRLIEDRNEFRNENLKVHSLFRDVQSKLKEILRDTNKLVKSDSSLFKQLTPIITGAAAYFGAKMATKEKAKPEIKEGITDKPKTKE